MCIACLRHLTAAAACLICLLYITGVGSRGRAGIASSSSSSRRSNKHAVCRMSANDGNDEFRPTVNPLIATLLGAAFLSSDPAVTFAAQSAREAMLSSPATEVASPTLVLAAGTSDPELKSLLGEVRLAWRVCISSTARPTGSSPHCDCVVSGCCSRKNSFLLYTTCQYVCCTTTGTAVRCSRSGRHSVVI